MSLLSTLNSIYETNKAFTKKFHDEVKRNLDDYEAKNTDRTQKKKGVYNRHVTSSRYDITIPYIFGTHESMISSFFENMPDLVINGRNSETDKVEIIKATYEYLKDKADLDEFLATSAWWFFLVGFVSADIEFKSEIEGYTPQLDQMGNPMIDEMTGEEVNIPIYSINDPVATVENLLKIFFSPESEFTIDGKKVPNYVKERLVNVDEIKDIYEVEVDPDTTLEVEGLESKEDALLGRANVKYFYGRLPSTCSEYLKEHNIKWSFRQNYKAIYTKDKLLLVEEIEEKPCKFARFYANLGKFFGFGIGKTLRPFQEDMSIRRSQQIAYADRFAFPWLTVGDGLKVDQKALMDYQKRVPLVYSGDKMPEYLSPPNMPSAISDADQASRSDAQFVSGTLDISKGAQQTNTVKTATGQQLFAQSQDKRLNKARKSIAKYYRETVIQMFKLARDNWGDDEKRITYTSDDGLEKDVAVTAEMLQGIDFDTDIDFNLDNVSVNQDIMSQRWISLIDTALNVPSADLDKIYQKVLRDSFKIQNPEFYVKEAPPVDPMTGQPMADPMAQAPVENPETIPQPETLGSQLAPQPY
jgi:hypothetical protein